MKNYKIFPSGLRLVTHKMPAMYTVSCGVYVNVGSIKEDTNENGYSHFVEHLMFKGTANRGYQEISECMDNIGAQLNAFTAKDNTCYYTKSGSVYIEQCLDLLSDLYFNSTFDSAELEKEKSVILEEIYTNDDNAEDVCQDLIAQSLYGDSKLGQTILGNADNIRYSDRHSILEFRNKHYKASNTVISIAGNFEDDKVLELIDKYFETNFANEEYDIDEVAVDINCQHLHCYKDVEQAHVALAFPTIPWTDDRLQHYNLMSSILGGGMSSRLFQIIREQHGLAYSVFSYPSIYKNNGFVEIYCATNPNNIDKVSKLFGEILTDYIDNGITQQELDRAKAQSKNGLYMSFENSLNVMMAFGRKLLKIDQLFDVDASIANIDKVTIEDVNRAIKDTFTMQYASCYVGKEISNHSALSNIFSKK